jgi:hypothetical protein
MGGSANSLSKQNANMRHRSGGERAGAGAAAVSQILEKAATCLPRGEKQRSDGRAESLLELDFPEW